MKLMKGIRRKYRAHIAMMAVRFSSSFDPDVNRAANLNSHTRLYVQMITFTYIYIYIYI